MGSVLLRISNSMEKLSTKTTNVEVITIPIVKTGLKEGGGKSQKLNILRLCRVETSLIDRCKCVRHKQGRIQSCEDNNVVPNLLY